MSEREIQKQSAFLCVVIGELAGCTELALDYITNENSQVDKDTLVEVMKNSIEHFNQFIANEGDD